MDVFQPENLQAVFDYLAIQVYARASAEDQRTLLELCWLSRIPSAALQVLCPDPGAGRLLDHLYRTPVPDRRPATQEASETASDVARGYVYHSTCCSSRSCANGRARRSPPRRSVRPSGAAR